MIKHSAIKTGAISDEEYDYIRNLVYERSRINLGTDKKELVRSRLQKRLTALGLDSFEAYLAYLENDSEGDEMTLLLDVISTNVTEFFREWKHYEFLRDTVLPRWEDVLQKKPGQPLRVWSAACSSGEEPYSLAILLAEYFRSRPLKPAWEVTATDISTRMLEVAQKGVYRGDRIKLPDPAWLRSHFQKGVGESEGFFRVKPELRKSVRFAHLNLFDWPFPFQEKFNAIFCRNVMIYFDAATQRELVPHLVDRLLPGGLLFVGHSESLLGIEHGMKCVGSSVYQVP